MYPSVLQYPFITPYSYSLSYCNCVESSPIYNWLMNGKTAQYATAYPSYSDQVISANTVRRYLASVSVPRIPVVVSSVTLAAAATASYTFYKAKAASSSNTAAATVAIVNGVVTITAVAAGTSTITISDINSKTIAVITVTVA